MLNLTLKDIIPGMPMVNKCVFILDVLPDIFVSCFLTDILFLYKVAIFLQKLCFQLEI